MYKRKLWHGYGETFMWKQLHKCDKQERFGELAGDSTRMGHTDTPFHHAFCCHSDRTFPTHIWKHPNRILSNHPKQDYSDVGQMGLIAR